MSVTKNMMWNDQSAFFSQLHHHVRREIYIQLFGEKLVHVQHKPYGRADYYLANYCCGKTGNPHGGTSGVCDNHGHLSTNLLFTCKRAFHEGLAILYATNKLSFDCSRHFAYFGVYSQANLSRVRYLDFAIRAFYQTDSGCVDMRQILKALINRVPFAVEVRISLNIIHEGKSNRALTKMRIENSAPKVMEELGRVMNMTTVRVEFSIPEALAPSFQANVKESWTRFKLNVVPKKGYSNAKKSDTRRIR